MIVTKIHLYHIVVAFYVIWSPVDNFLIGNHTTSSYFYIVYLIPSQVLLYDNSCVKQNSAPLMNKCTFKHKQCSIAKVVLRLLKFLKIWYAGERDETSQLKNLIGLFVQVFGSLKQVTHGKEKQILNLTKYNAHI